MSIMDNLKELMDMSAVQEEDNPVFISRTGEFNLFSPKHKIRKNRKYGDTGVAYSEDGKTLEECPAIRPGRIRIHEGVERIGVNAFRSIICIVEDSCPECSFSTPAARAVGAHSRISSSGCLFLKRSIAPQIVCVFPVPPRPRSKTTLFLSKLFRNSSCSLLYLSLIDSNTSSFVPISVFICINLLIWNAISASLSIVRINPSMPFSQYTLFISTRVAKR